MIRREVGREDGREGLGRQGERWRERGKVIIVGASEGWDEGDAGRK